MRDVEQFVKAVCRMPATELSPELVLRAAEHEWSLSWSPTTGLAMRRGSGRQVQLRVFGSTAEVERFLDELSRLKNSPPSAM